jgi:hypothetical protein
LAFGLSFLPKPAAAHEPGGPKKPIPPAAKRDLEMARKALDAAKHQLAQQGKYACCVQPSCDLCARANGSCACAANLLAGKGVCGECQGGWKAGHGTIKGVQAASVALLPSPQQKAEGAVPSPDLAQAFTALDNAKRVLVQEGRYSCCVRPGCDMCAFEGNCPCGGELLKGAKNEGVCGQCVDGWHAGHGALEGVEMAHVHHGEMHGMAGMEHMARHGSGTSWVPDSSPVYAKHLQSGPWALMLHGNAFLDYDNQGGPRGATRVISENWGMAMAERGLGRDRLRLRAMLSLEPYTIRPRGYPELFQTGETFRGRPLVDAQHPHDLFMELAAQYFHPLGKGSTLSLYLAPVGEPALGPPAYMHRPSAMDNPIAPLAHHWQDSTHISFGVATLGLESKQWKAEVSRFNGHEPDSRRSNFDPIRLNSTSGRLSYNPTPNWAFQASYGRLRGPEELHPGEDQDRATASVLYNRPRPEGNLALALVWGRKHENGDSTNGFALEGNWQFRERDTLFGRIDRVRERGLLRTAEPESEPAFTINAFSIGYSHDISHSTNWETAIGGMVTFYDKPGALDPIYGRSPVSFHLFLRLRPGRVAQH